MNKMKQLFGLMAVLALVAFASAPVMVLASDATPVPAAQLTVWDSILPIVLAVLVPVASLLANLSAISETDKPWVKFLKKVVNTFALNFSAKAGQ